MSGSSIEAFKRFALAKRKRFKAIERKTGDEYTPEDIEGEAWLMAPVVAQKTGVSLDFDDPRFQDCLIAFLYNGLTRYTETVVRYAVKLDRQIDGENVAADDHPAMRQWAATEFNDPLQHLIEAEEADADHREHGPHESRAGAYLHLLQRFDNRMSEVADHLLISRSYCYFRYNEARRMVEQQLVLPAAGLVTGSASHPQSWRAFRAVRQWTQIELDFGHCEQLWASDSSPCYRKVH